MNYTSLSHHGILGQKWGVRRYQNEDGSLTPRGKKKYGQNSLSDKNTKVTDLKTKSNKGKKIVAGILATSGAILATSFIASEVSARKNGELSVIQALKALNAIKKEPLVR